MLELITPNWPAPSHVKAFTTTRLGGYSQGHYASFNLAAHVNDDHNAVMRNRALLKKHLNLAGEPLWLQQVHGIDAIQADAASLDNPIADASFTRKSQIICAVLTADCLPLLITDNKGSCVAAIHAGWKGLAAGVIEATLEKLNSAPQNLFAWLGPAIGPRAFEVGDEVYEQFIKHDAQAKSAFQRQSNDRWLADIYMLAKQRLIQQGVTQIFGGDFCTYTDTTRFFSYRRDKETGRMASLIWLT